MVIKKNIASKFSIRDMFNSIASDYDITNRVLSLGIDRYWRRKSLSMIAGKETKTILDVATGTGDFSIMAQSLNPKRIIGIDIAEDMLAIGRRKIETMGYKNIILQKGDAESMPFEANTFDAVIVSFGVRNFSNFDVGLKNIYKVLKKDGVFLMLEFSVVSNPILKPFYKLYCNHIVPMIGRLITKNAYAYTYLPRSIDSFPKKKEFLSLLKNIGFHSIVCKNLTLGVVSSYMAFK